MPLCTGGRYTGLIFCNKSYWDLFEVAVIDRRQLYRVQGRYQQIWSGPVEPDLQGNLVRLNKILSYKWYRTGKKVVRLNRTSGASAGVSIKADSLYKFLCAVLINATVYYTHL